MTKPAPGVVFGLFLDTDKHLFRATTVYENLKSKTFKVFLLDVGETLEIALDTHDCYQLSDNFQKIPGQATLCFLEKVSYLLIK